MKKFKIFFLIIAISLTTFVIASCNNIVLDSISISTAPKVTYTVGERFDATGMVIEAKYSDNTSNIITDYEINNTNPLTIEDTKITISYTKNKITKSVDINITVTNISDAESVFEDEPINIGQDNNYFVFIPKESGHYLFYSTGGGKPTFEIYNLNAEMMAWDYGVVYNNDANYSLCIGLVEGNTYYIKINFDYGHDNGNCKMFIQKYTYPKIEPEDVFNLDAERNYFELVAEESGYYRINTIGSQYVFLEVFDKEYKRLSSSSTGASYGLSYTYYLEKGDFLFLKISLYDFGGNVQGTVSIERQYLLEVISSEGGCASITYWNFTHEEGQYILYSDTAITLAAINDMGCAFEGWFDGETLLSADTVYSFDMPKKDLILEARFVYTDEFILTVMASEGGTVNTAGGQYLNGSNVTLIATPKENYTFEGWYEGERKESSNANYILSMPNYDMNLEARFTFYKSGNGTKNNPFIIATKAQLIYLAEMVNTIELYSQNKYFALSADISLDGMEWQPIGFSKDYSGKYVFRGDFDGRGHMVSNFKITENNTYDVGFFGSSYGIIKNFGIKDFIINLINTDNVYHVGGLVGQNDENSVVSKCFAVGTVSIISKNSPVSVGGLIGRAYGTVDNSYAVCDVTASCTQGYAYAGGLIGESYKNISYCYALGNVLITAPSLNGYAGGLIGKSNYGSIIGSFAKGNVSSIGQSDFYCRAGGLVGTTSSYSFINSYRFEGQTFYRKPGKDEFFTASNDFGEICTTADLQNALFYSNKLLWDTQIWDLSKLPPSLMSVDIPQKTVEGYESGKGTKSDPYVIKTADQLVYFADQVNTGNNYSKNRFFVLRADIDLSGIDWVPIGYLSGDYYSLKYSKTFQGY